MMTLFNDLHYQQGKNKTNVRNQIMTLFFQYYS